VRKKSVVALAVLSGLLLLILPDGCGRKKVEELKKDELFSIPIGTGEEQIGVIKQTNGELVGPSSVLFRNGFFYVVDPLNNKVLKITTPGDIILVLSQGYEEKNDTDELLRTKQRRFYPFSQIGNIAVDNENNIYLEEKLLEKEPQKDEVDLFISTDSRMEGNGERYVSRILKFDRLGNYLFSIGKNGPETEPFYYLYQMNVDRNGNLTVLTADQNWEEWIDYEFDHDGRFLSKRSVGYSEVFDGKDMDERSFFIMDVFPEYSSTHLVYWVSLYTTAFDTKEMRKEEDLWAEEIEIKDPNALKEREQRQEEKKTGRDLLYYKLLYYNLKTGEIEKTFRWENELGEDTQSTEEFFGMDGESDSFLWKYTDPTRAIISIYDANGTFVARRSFVFEDDGIWNNVQVAVDGSIYGVKISERSLSFYRWRSDDLIHSKREKVTLKEFVREKIQGFRNANR
jgi:hypothetical protein